ncbi:head-tail adaptor protein [Algirhabdus cladophorae]|uniref:head-tail adaptor protein n=1 Tax=Algirhabdus cladophorae TaxID=3377108 RepID=UPI003B84A79C
MNPVNLCRQLVLEQAVQIPDGAGGFNQTWQALGKLWAEVKASSGRVPNGDLGPVSRVNYKITVRAAPHGAESRPQPDQRFTEGSRVFRINAVGESDAHGGYLTCYAHEEVVS